MEYGRPITPDTGDNSPEFVALLLTRTIADLEQRELFSGGSAPHPADRKWFLDTYAECLEATMGKRKSLPKVGFE